MKNEAVKPKVSAEAGGQVDPLVMCSVKAKAGEVARFLRDECDGSYVGAEITRRVSVLGSEVDLFVCAFWEKSFWFDFNATVNGVQYSSTEYT